MKKETITVTEIKGRDVKYSGSKYFHGSDISNFPKSPKVGEQYILISDFNNPSRIIEKTEEEDS